MLASTNCKNGGHQQDRWKIADAVVSLGTLGHWPKRRRLLAGAKEKFVDMGELRRGQRETAVAIARRGEVVPIVRWPHLALQAQT